MPLECWNCKDNGAELKVVLGDVEAPLQQDVSYKNTAVICNKDRTVSLCSTVTCKAQRSPCYSLCCLSECYCRWFLQLNVAPDSKCMNTCSNLVHCNVPIPRPKRKWLLDSSNFP